MRRLVAMSSVTEATYPFLMALVRTATLVPTSMAQLQRLPTTHDLILVPPQQSGERLFGFLGISLLGQDQPTQNL